MGAIGQPALTSLPSASVSSATAGPGGVLSRPGPVARASTSLLVQSASPRPAAGFAAPQAVAACADVARSPILQAIAEEGGRGTVLARPRTGRLADGLLDELIADPVMIRPREADRLVVVRAPAMPPGVETRAERGADVAGAGRHSVIPAGPMSRRESPRRSAGLAELLLAAGFCGFGAGLRAARRTEEGRGCCRAPNADDTDGASPLPRARRPV
jgi:hypothetical protein